MMSLHTSHKALVLTAGLGFFILSMMVSVLPALQMQKIKPHPAIVERTAEEELGRDLYIAEGCTVCHTQFVRDLPMDAPYGRESVASDFALESPPLLGTQRTGPDLSNVGIRQPSSVWNLIHLYNPRAVVPESVMPGYPWYFQSKTEQSEGDTVVPVPEHFVPDGKIVVASEEALAIVAYLQSLKQVKDDD